MSIENINQILIGLTCFAVFCSAVVTIHDPDSAPPLAKATTYTSLVVAVVFCVFLAAALIVKLLTGHSVFPQLGV